MTANLTTPVVFLYWFDIVALGPTTVRLRCKRQDDNSSTCTIVIADVPHTLYAVPAGEFSAATVCEEIGFGKVVTRSYAFGEPRGTSEFVKLNRNPPPGNTFHTILGDSVGPCESFLLRRHICGPCWLAVTGPSYKDVVPWTTAIEGVIDAPPPRPQFRVMYLAEDSYAIDLEPAVHAVPTLATVVAASPDVIFCKRIVFEQLQGDDDNHSIIVADLPTLAHEIIRSPMRSYELDDIAAFLEIPPLSTKADLCRTIVIKLDIINLTLLLTNIAGNVWRSSLACNRIERVEYYLAHEFFKRRFILPDNDSRKRRRHNDDGNDDDDESYEGGLVLESQTGLCNQHVCLLDFKSLYPSIIREFNLCFVPESPILPDLVGALVDARRNAVGEPTKQAALKLFVNSLYGCIGSTHSRFYNKKLASDITAAGRAALQRAHQIVTKSSSFTVLFGDTDSLAVVCNREQATALLAEINSGTTHVKMAIDNEFSALYVVRKKAYAYIDAATGQMHIKGLEIIKRDYCGLVKRIGTDLLRCILTGQSIDSVLVPPVITNVATDLSITKFLGKNPQDYPHDEKTMMPHAQVGLALGLRAGDAVTYVMGKNGVAMPLATPSLTVADVDVEWYLQKQVAPVLTRLLEPLASGARVRRALGLATVQQIAEDLAYRSDPTLLEDEILRQQQQS